MRSQRRYSFISAFFSLLLLVSSSPLYAQTMGNTNEPLPSGSGGDGGTALFGGSGPSGGSGAATGGSGSTTYGPGGYYTDANGNPAYTSTGDISGPASTGGAGDLDAGSIANPPDSLGGTGGANGGLAGGTGTAGGASGSGASSGGGAKGGGGGGGSTLIPSACGTILCIGIPKASYLGNQKLVLGCEILTSYFFTQCDTQANEEAQASANEKAASECAGTGYGYAACYAAAYEGYYKQDYETDILQCRTTYLELALTGPPQCTVDYSLFAAKILALCGNSDVYNFTDCVTRGGG